jgi:ABC-type molybdenum transport system ATPase subunit/photorepair protein PhrA
MRRTNALFFAASRCAQLHTTRRLWSEPIVKITNGTFYRQHPSSKPTFGQDVDPNPVLFPNMDLTLPSFSTPNQHWAILSPSSNIRTAFLQVLRGHFICVPPTARTHPYLLSEEVAQRNPNLRYPERAIEYVGFDVERRAFGGAYLSARYESLKEDTDFTLQRYLTGITTLNPGEEEMKAKAIDPEVMRKVMHDLELERFLEKPVAMLSNGQSRRARIGKALLAQPLMLCLDAPFIGLDPIVTKHISKVLHRLAEAKAPRIVLSLRPQDAVPDWITHVVYAGDDGKVDSLGPKEEVFAYLKMQYEDIEKSGRIGNAMDAKLVELREVGRHLSESGNFDSHDPSSSLDTVRLSRDGYTQTDSSSIATGEPIVEMDGVRISYGSNSVLGDWPNGLNFTIHRGQRWGIFGANGSGKTTLLSLVTSDHPQTYSAPVKLFGRSRLPEPGVPGITIFEIQSKMGHASPEVHALFPKHLRVRTVLESAWSDTPITKAKLNNDATKRVDACLKWFENEINPSPKTTEGVEWTSQTLFGEISYSAQRILLFLRSTIRNPDIVILDEAFSGMDDLARDKCLLFLSRGQSMKLTYTETGPKPVEWDGEVIVPGLQEHQALLVVSHSKQEIPGCVRDWICLPEAGTGPARFGKWDGPVELNGRRWDEIWDW